VGAAFVYGRERLEGWSSINSAKPAVQSLAHRRCASKPTRWLPDLSRKSISGSALRFTVARRLHLVLKDSESQLKTLSASESGLTAEKMLEGSWCWESDRNRICPPRLPHHLFCRRAHSALSLRRSQIGKLGNEKRLQISI
jgi:hypothetical protein